MKRSEALSALGLKDRASPDEIKSAFRSLSMRHHPDRNPGDPDAAARFGRVREAYETLLGSRRADPEVAAAPTSASRPLNGRDISLAVEVSLEDAFHGGPAVIRGSGAAACPTCCGRGLVETASASPCPVCGGAGAIERGRGIVTVKARCPNCEGTGAVTSVACGTCGGSGRNPMGGDVAVELPPGVEDGHVVTVPGGGFPGAWGGAAGDLNVTVRVARHERFRRRHADLSLLAPVSFAVACLGGSVSVEGVDGEAIDVPVAAGLPSGGLVVVAGKGMPRPGGGRGDLHVKLSVAVPATLTEEQAGILEMWKSAESRVASTQLVVYDNVDKEAGRLGDQ
jgi:molecular chaperone DnaJ